MGTTGQISTIYRGHPLRYLELPGGPVPVYSDRDAYVVNYERISEDHVAHMKKTGLNPFMAEEFWRASEQITEQLVRQYGIPGTRVLDVGCGLGRLLSRFPEFDRYGMDISPSYLQYAQQAGINICLARVEDMPYADEFFDLVICTDVLEHVFDLYGACLQLLRVIRPGGILVVRTPYRENLASYLSANLPYDYVHVRNFDEDSLRLLFEKIHGSQVVEIMKGPLLMPWMSLRCSFPVPGLTRLFRIVAGVTRLAGKSFYEAFLGWAFDPSEINVVVRVKANRCA